MPVIKRNQETFVRVLDALLQYGSLTKASAAAGIDPFTLARWRRASEDGEENFQEVDYQGIIQPLHRHVEDTIEQSIDEIESNLRASARDGFFRKIVWHGAYCYEPSETAHAMSDQQFQDAVELGLEWPDKLRRVKNEKTGEWERVAMMEWIPPSTEAQTIVLRSWSDRYADRRSLNINGRFDVNQTLGVTVIGSPKLAPPPQALQIVSPEVAETINETATDAAYAEIEAEAEDERIPEQIAEPFEPDPASPLSPEQQAILARARSGNRLAADLAARALARKTPTAPRPARDLDQDDSLPRNPVGRKIV
jgi:hypothetical protein